MSFGIVQWMIISLKNNSRKKELKHFDRSGMPINAPNIHFDELLKKQASKEQLKGIRQKLRKYNARQRTKAIIFTALTVATLVTTVMLFA
ncbi:hypothetical protein M0G43_12540 [Subsaxibacter sp. CAU 1640]|uniref:hypothetical protein n=1 Tax=Subsaxibacter sp. CAU 1640 TaxID=2933271 RepID=UPI002002E881|nr:hypothetical protein [Subsaxibacter sp. CAU 1640]MCK7591406.1 hypothetical protein [Subsaxibacter sp. CAU 1640]